MGLFAQLKMKCFYEILLYEWHMSDEALKGYLASYTQQLHVWLRRIEYQIMPAAPVIVRSEIQAQLSSKFYLLSKAVILWYPVFGSSYF